MIDYYITLHLFVHNKCSERVGFILPERWGVRRNDRDGDGGGSKGEREGTCELERHADI